MTRAIEVIVVPYEVERDDTGAARAPLALISHGFLERLERSGLKVHRSEVAARPSPSAPQTAPAAGSATGARPQAAHATGLETAAPTAMAAITAKIARVAEVGRGIARAVANAHSRKRFPLVLAGGCLSAVGVVTGLQRMGRELEVVWVDAHGDFNTPESTPSGYWDGMALAAVCGRSLPEVYKPVELRPVHFRHVVHLGGRAFDPPEVEDFRRLNLMVVPPEKMTSDEVRRRLEDTHPEAGKQREVYLHIDVDGLDPSEAPAVNYPEPGGPHLGDLLSCLGWLRHPAAMTLSSLDFERGERGGRASQEGAERTVEACARLVEICM